MTGLDSSVLQIKTKIVSSHTADSKPVEQEVNRTVLLPPLVFPGQRVIYTSNVGLAFSLNDAVSIEKINFFFISKWNGTFFALSLIIEGTTEKVLQFMMPLKSIYNRNFGFVEQKMCF